MPVVHSASQDLGQHPLGHRTKHKLPLRRQRPQRSHGRENVLSEANDAGAAPSALLTLVRGELGQNRGEQDSALQVGLLVSVNGLDQLTSGEDDRMVLVVRLAIAQHWETRELDNVLRHSAPILKRARRVHDTAVEPLRLLYVFRLHVLLPILIIHQKSDRRRARHPLQHLLRRLQLRAPQLQLPVQLHSHQALKLITADTIPRSVREVRHLQLEEHVHGAVALSHSFHSAPEGLHAEGGPATQLKLDLFVTDWLVATV
mmetsp:Transcript_62745/g.168281  ORF Transcript_62745/g.168281 Transcript_62745/m.168281 type:complete len:259 (-) Transcript_62745:2142-2918(-)